MGDGVINGTGKVVLGLVAIFLVPVMLRGLGTELFGLWLFASMVTSAVATVADLGLQLTVIREVGGAGTDAGEVAPLVSAAANLYLRIMLLGALVVIGTGAALLIRDQTSVATRDILARVFVIVSVGFVADQMCSFQLSVLQGLRRYDLSNLLSVSFCLLNALAIVCVLLIGGRLVGVVLAETAVSTVALIVSYLSVLWLAPPLGQRLRRLRLDVLRPHFSFSLLSQASVLANATLWNGPPMLIGLMLGPAGLVPYQLGCKFPLAAGNIAWEMAAVMIPASSRHQKLNRAASAADALETGTHLVLLLTLPLYIILWIVAPHLLTAWLGHVPAGTLLVLRIMTVASAVSAADVGASSLLTGRGMVGFLSATVFGVACVAMPLTAVLLRRIGPQGAAWALLVSAPIAALLMLQAACAACDISLSDLVRRAGRDVLIPAAICGFTAFLVVERLPHGRWLTVIASSSAGLLAYWIAYVVTGASQEERKLLRRAIDAVADLSLAAANLAYPALRALAKFSGLEPAQFPSLAGVVYSMGDPYRQVKIFDSEYARATDPWRYTIDPEKRESHQLALRLLESVRPPQGFRSAMEIGCAEGVFTEMLAPLCRSLMAVDFSELALQRAGKRRDWPDIVTFRHWNLRTDPLPGQFDLIVAMDVLGYIRRPGKLRQVFERLGAALERGDILFAGDFRESFDDSWMARRLGFGGRWAIQALATYPGFEIIKRVSTPTHEFVVLRKL